MGRRMRRGGGRLWVCRAEKGEGGGRRTPRSGMQLFAFNGRLHCWGGCFCLGAPMGAGDKGGLPWHHSIPKMQSPHQIARASPRLHPPPHPPSCKSTPRMQLQPQIAPPPHPPGCNLTPQTAALGALRGLLLPPPAVQRRSDGVLLLPMWSRRRHTWLGDSQGCNYRLGRGSEGKGEQRRGCRGCRG